MGPWDDPGYLKQCGSYHSIFVIHATGRCSHEEEGRKEAIIAYSFVKDAIRAPRVYLVSEIHVEVKHIKNK